MSQDSLWARLRSFWRSSDDADRKDEGDESATDGGNETLSYAEQVEYGVDERDLGDEDKVLRLLVKQGGRVDRETVLQETGWSESRLATTVERMESENQVSAISVGRKRVICRRGFEPKGYRSHLNE
ncbi:hypothetical protein OB905_11900 [Halobacteria archaeon AArc-dxtr1]|nr:hypothetical protein [Halobacteria archaeon AArc-dxtr1]